MKIIIERDESFYSDRGLWDLVFEDRKLVQILKHLENGTLDEAGIVGEVMQGCYYIGSADINMIQDINLDSYSPEVQIGKALILVYNDSVIGQNLCICPVGKIKETSD